MGSGLQREKFVMMRLLQTSQNLSHLNKSWFTVTIFNLHAFTFLLRGFHPHNNKKSRLQCLNKEKKTIFQCKLLSLKPSNIQLPVHVLIILYKQLPVFATQYNKRTPALFILRIWSSFQKACNETLDLTAKSKDFL